MRFRPHCRVPYNIGERLQGSGTEQCQLFEGTRETRLRDKELELRVDYSVVGLSTLPRVPNYRLLGTHAGTWCRTTSIDRHDNST